MTEKRTAARRAPGVSVGGASLLMVFTVLCLTIFAVLSLVTAVSDKKLSARSADAVTAWYAADGVCEEYIASLREGQAAGETAAELLARLPEGAVYAAGEHGAAALAFAVPIDDTQELRVTAELSEGRLRITQWQAVRTADWTPEETLQLWDGEPLS